MSKQPKKSYRVFKTAWFLKAAKKAGVPDRELCSAVQQVSLGQADDLGGGVYKKRLNRNLHRSILLAKGQRCWVYAYLFAKQDRANIEADELADFRRLARSYAGLTDQQINQLLQDGDWTEICHDTEAQIQE